MRVWQMLVHYFSQFFVNMKIHYSIKLERLCEFSSNLTTNSRTLLCSNTIFYSDILQGTILINFYFLVKEGFTDLLLTNFWF